MSYLPYVVAAYAVFAIVLGWDYIAPRLQVRAQLRAARARAARRTAPAARDPAAPLSREQAGIPVSRDSL